jgi:hypothetical protein
LSAAHLSAVNLSALHWSSKYLQHILYRRLNV